MDTVCPRRPGGRDDSAGVKDVGGKKRGWLGVHTDFHFSPSAYVKMLSLSPSQVLPLQMPELSVRNGLQRGGVGGRGWGGARGRKSGKISILNKHNFVTLSPDYHGTSFAMFPQLPVSSLLLSRLLLFSLPPFIFLKNSLRQCFRPESLCQFDELYLTAF